MARIEYYFPGKHQTKGGLGLSANNTQVPKNVRGGAPPPGYKIKTGVTVKSQIGLKGGVPKPGMCSYHQELPAAFICNRCGKSICSSCAIRYGQVVFCPQCSPVSGGQQPPGYGGGGYYPYSYHHFSLPNLFVNKLCIQEK